MSSTAILSDHLTDIRTWGTSFVLRNLHRLQEKQRDLKAPPTSRPRDSDVAGTLRGLNLQQAQALLAATQRRSYAHQVGETGRRFSSDWQQSLQDAARDPAYMAHNHGRIGR